MATSWVLGQGVMLDYEGCMAACQAYKVPNGFTLNRIKETHRCICICIGVQATATTHMGIQRCVKTGKKVSPQQLQ